MKRLFILIILSLFSSFLLVPSAHARIIKSDTSAIISESEVIDDDVFITGEEVEISGTVNGDVYAAGGSIVVSGTINGDLIGAGGNIVVSGTIQDDLRVAGGNISVQNAEIGDNVTVFGGNIYIGGETDIGGSLSFGAGALQNKATVARNIFGGAGAITIDAPVGKNVTVGTEKLRIGPNTTIAGNVAYYSDNEIKLDEGATIVGTVQKIIPTTKKFTKESKEAAEQPKKSFTFGFKIWSYLAALLVGGVILYFFPKQSQRVADIVTTDPFPSLGWGLVILIGTPIAIITLMITVIGIPLAFILGLLYMLDLYVAKLIVGYAIGSKLIQVVGTKNANAFLVFALGLAAYYVLTMIPIISVFVTIAALLLGLGAKFALKRELLKLARN